MGRSAGGGDVVGVPVRVKRKAELKDKSQPTKSLHSRSTRQGTYLDTQA
jgi:hypothetical protein